MDFICGGVAGERDGLVLKGDIWNCGIPDLSDIICGGEQISICVGCEFNILNDIKMPCVESIWSIGITGSCFSPIFKKNRD